MPVKSYYPINLDIKNKKCVVVGGGVVAGRKIKSLLNYGALVTVISPKLTKQLQAFKEQKKIIHLKKKYNPSYLKSAFLAVGATNESKVNASLDKLAKENNLLVNIVDNPAYGNFIVPAVVKRGPLSIAVSTSGISPALAKKIRIDLGKRYGNRYRKLLHFLAKVRPSVIKQVKEIKKRRKILKKLAYLEI